MANGFRKNLKVIASLSMAVFSLAVAFAGTFAWFQTKTSYTLSNEGEEDPSERFPINNLSDLITFSYKVYKYDQKQEKGVVYEEGSDVDLSLNTYDAKVQSRNTNNMNIIRFQVDFIAIEGTADKTLTFAIDCNKTTVGSNFDALVGDSKTRTHSDNNGYKYSTSSNQFLCNNISNVTSYGLFLNSYTTSTQTIFSGTHVDESQSADGIYQSAKGIMNSSSKLMFVNNGTKNGQIVLNIPNISVDTKSLVFYFGYDYNLGLIQDYQSKSEFIGSESLVQDLPQIKFANDIEKIELGLE